MKKVLIAVLAVTFMLAAFLAFNLVTDSDQPEVQDTGGQNTQDPQQEAGQGTGTTSESEDGITISYTDSGFTQDNYTVKSGETVTVVNNSDAMLQFSSDDHPAHTDNLELNLAQLRPGESTSFQPSRTGTWGFHNHEQSAHTGTLTVE